MKVKSLLTIALFLVLFYSGQTLIAQEASSKVSVGEKLEREFWNAMKTNDMKWLEKKVVKNFQSLHPDGSRSKKEELDLISKLNLGPFKLTDFVVTQEDDVIIVTYFVSVEETIKGEKLPTKPTARLSVWMKVKDDWMLATHANLNPMK